MQDQIAIVVTSPTLRTHYTPLIFTYMYLHHQCPASPCISLAVTKPKLNVPFCSCAVPQKHVPLTFVYETRETKAQTRYLEVARC